MKTSYLTTLLMVIALLQIHSTSRVLSQTVDDPRNFKAIWLYKGGMSEKVKYTTNFPGTQKDYTYSELKKAFPFVKGFINPIAWCLLEKQGAAQEYPGGSRGGQTNNHHAKSVNDLNWDIFRSNYERYITQYIPNETSNRLLERRRYQTA